MKEIIVLEAFHGLLTGRQIINDKRSELKVPLADKSIGRALFEEEPNTAKKTFKIGKFEWQGKSDADGKRIFELVSVD